jgi:hypothetical protein
MRCQYSTRGLVSSEKHDTPPGEGMEGRGADPSGGVTAAGVMADADPLLVPLMVVSRAAKRTKT